MEQSLSTQPDTAREAIVAIRCYITVQVKFVLALTVASAWAALSNFIAQQRILELSGLVGAPFAFLVIFGIAIVLGIMYAFLVTGLLLDRRPRRKPFPHYADITILVEAYNEIEQPARQTTSIPDTQPNTPHVIRRFTTDLNRVLYC
jgi:biofilm PGA synthesis N-glycosyltransferase PgaC